MTDCVIWDWNGTLLDDVDLCVEALNWLLAQFGYPQRYDRAQYQGIFGFPTLLQNSLGTTSFSWVMLLNTFIGILVAYFQKTGAIQGFSQKVHEKNLSRRGAQLMAWVLGIFIYFSDSFSPLFVGSVMRSITDKAFLAQRIQVS